MTVSLAPLLTRLNLAAEDLPMEALPELIGILEATKLRATQRLLAGAAAPSGDAHPSERFVGAAEMAALLGLPEHWVRDNARRRRIPSLRVGHYRVFDPPAVMAAVRALAVGQDSPSCETRPRRARKNGDLSGRGAAASAAMDTESVQEVGTPVHPSSPAGRGP